MKVIAALAAAAALAAPARAAERPALAGDASVSPASVLFGDPVDVAVQVLVDDDRVDPATLKLEADAAPLTRLGPIERDSWQSGGLAYVRFRFRVACAADGCLARRRSPCACARSRCASPLAGTMGVSRDPTSRGRGSRSGGGSTPSALAGDAGVRRR